MTFISISVNMDILQRKREGILLRLGVANAKVWASQAQLYEGVYKQKITLDTLKTQRHFLDTDIKIVLNHKQ